MSPAFAFSLVSLIHQDVSFHFPLPVTEETALAVADTVLTNFVPFDITNLDIPFDLRLNRRTN